MYLIPHTSTAYKSVDLIIDFRSFIFSSQPLDLPLETMLLTVWVATIPILTYFWVAVLNLPDEEKVQPR